MPPLYLLEATEGERRSCGQGCSVHGTNWISVMYTRQPEYYLREDFEERLLFGGQMPIFGSAVLLNAIIRGHNMKTEDILRTAALSWADHRTHR